MTGETLLLQPEDDVAVALRAVPGVPRGHKVAVRGLAAGAPIRKYGQVIGLATAPIAGADEEGPVTERSEGTGEHSTLVIGRMKEAR